MIKNKNIYLNSYNEIKEFEQQRLTKYCEWPGCEKKVITKLLHLARETKSF